MRRLDTLSPGSDRLRLGPWRGDPTVALLSPSPGIAPTRAVLTRAVDELTARGYRAVLTPALTPLEQLPFLTHGFSVHERLHLLRHHLDRRPSSRHDLVRLRRGRERDVVAVLTVDRAAFDAFWRFDRAGLADARAATPTHRFRVCDSHWRGRRLPRHRPCRQPRLPPAAGRESGATRGRHRLESHR